MRKKLFLSISSIAVVLLISMVISFMEFKNMSSYVSDLIADDISSINVARKLSDISNQYNLEILSVIGDESSVKLPQFDADFFMSHCDSLKTSISYNVIEPYADAVMYSYSAYMLTSLELEDVMASDFIDTRSWYFERLQPKYETLKSNIDKLIDAVYSDLERDSANFDSGFYRSVVPGIVAVGVAIMLLLILMFYLLFYYVVPLIKIKNALKSYNTYGKNYNYSFEGDDQLSEINQMISQLCLEHSILSKRVKNHESANNK